MQDYFPVGPVPTEERALLVNMDEYWEYIQRESAVYIRQLERHFADRPRGIEFTRRIFTDYLGSRYEVIMLFDRNLEEHVDFMYFAGENKPLTWDEQAGEELGGEYFEVVDEQHTALMLKEAQYYAAKSWEKRPA